MVLAKYIDTDLWNKAIDLLTQRGWLLTYTYDGMDAGIDYNCYKLNSGTEEIVFEWTNWDEGEIRCTADRLKEIENLLGLVFKVVEPVESHPPRNPQ